MPVYMIDSASFSCSGQYTLDCGMYSWFTGVKLADNPVTVDRESKILKDQHGLVGPDIRLSLQISW